MRGYLFCEQRKAEGSVESFPTTADKERSTRSKKKTTHQANPAQILGLIHLHLTSARHPHRLQARARRSPDWAPSQDRDSGFGSGYGAARRYRSVWSSTATARRLGMASTRCMKYFRIVHLGTRRRRRDHGGPPRSAGLAGRGAARRRGIASAEEAEAERFARARMFVDGRRASVSDRTMMARATATAAVMPCGLRASVRVREDGGHVSMRTRMRV